MEIVTDLRILNAISRRANEQGGEWEFDKDYRYYVGKIYTRVNKIEYKGNLYKLQYFDGCFRPFLVKC